MTPATRPHRPPPGNAEPQLGKSGEDAELGLGAPRQPPTIPPGYKQTEVGIIPEDWEVKRLGDIAPSVTSGKSGTGASSSLFPVFGSTGIIGYSSHADYSGDAILIARVGANAGRLQTVSGEYGVTDNTIIVRLDKSIVRGFMARHLQLRNLNSMVFGSGQPLITGTQIKALRIPLPPTRTEQEAIAGALSDADAWIESLEKLIEKKRAIKQGTMQALLTPPGQPGHQRLPGFEGEWEVKRLGEIADIRSGGTPATGDLCYWGGGIPWCTPTDITALNGAKYLDRTERTISQLGLESSSAEVVPANSVVMTSRATIGECAINRGTMTTNQGFKNLIPFEDTNVEYLFYLMQTQKQGLISLCGGSTFLEIGKTQVQGYAVSVPPSLHEQSAIATVLSDMDAEIEAVEAKLQKARRIKQGMMQELLTGRVRLV